MNTAKIKQLAEVIESKQRELEKARFARSDLDFDGHQRLLMVRIGGIELEVSNTPSGGNSKVKRGYEMIHLGVVRLYNEEIDRLEKKIAEKEKELRGLLL